MKREWSGQVIFISSHSEAVMPIVEELRKRQPSVDAFLSDGENLQAPECGLFVIDTERIASVLRKVGLAVVGYEHEKNKEQDFSFLPYVVTHPEELEQSDFVHMWNRLTGNPCEILETERLAVRETTVEDIDVFYELYKDPAVTKYMENLFDDPEEERAYQSSYIRNIYGLYDYGIWTVIEKASGKIIGRAGVAPREGFADPELGFVIGKEWQGKGYAFEICSAVLEYAFRTLMIPAVIAVVHRQNEASLALCRKLGFLGTENDSVENHQIFMLKAEDFYTEIH